MASLKEGWYRVPKVIRKPLIFIIGSSVIIAGLIMLVFPGPGWAAIFLGFAILATEFAFAEKVRDWLVQFLKNLIQFGLSELKKPWQAP
jgi:uncharacterized protein (TIGR02611 family)